MTGRGVLSLLATVVRFEATIWRNLWRWARRLPPRTGPGEVGFGYDQAVAPLLRIFIIVSAVEIPIFHLIVPWPTVRLLVDLAGVYGLIWMFGLLATMRQEPHAVGPSGVRVRFGILGRIVLSWDSIADVGVRDRTLPPGSPQVEQDGELRAVHIPVAQQTNLDITLGAPMTLPLRRARGRPVNQLRIFADDPDGFVAAVRAGQPADEPTA
ncbi:hypothetical protein [Pilimelia columellifera]|uniref:PH domain-containing protein n=1 Tax=Pilimelia columellifera subsp. columellifera TaxID=706583 RepID=A0ABN3NLD7_9ACTN